MKDEQKKEYGISIIKGAIGAIPFAGTFLNEVSFEARSRMKQERVNNFIEEFSDFISGHKNSLLELETLYADQISDVFEEIIISISKTSADHKKEVFKNILLKQLISSTHNTEESLRFINITNELTNIQFQILSAFNSLSDTMLKCKIQLLELDAEAKGLKTQIIDLEGEVTGNPERIEKLKNRLGELPRLIRKKTLSLKSGKINPNYHTTFNLNRKDYLTEVQDLLAKGLLFDFVLRTQIVDPFVHFGITELGRSYMKYVTT